MGIADKTHEPVSNVFQYGFVCVLFFLSFFVVLFLLLPPLLSLLLLSSFFFLFALPFLECRLCRNETLAAIYKSYTWDEILLFFGQIAFRLRSLCSAIWDTANECEPFLVSQR